MRHQLQNALHNLQSQSEVIVQLKTDKEQLVLCHAELEAKLESSDRDSYHVMETLDQVQRNGDRLEEQLQETQCRITELETKNRHLEEELNDEKDKEKSLQG